jgi:antibiotic biosynthesis monooxygenase (ABM) superfamily enzyme
MNALTTLSNGRILSYNETLQIRFALEKRTEHLRALIEQFERNDNLRQWIDSPKRDLEDTTRVLEALENSCNVLRIGEIGKV